MPWLDTGGLPSGVDVGIITMWRIRLRSSSHLLGMTVVAILWLAGPGEALWAVIVMGIVIAVDRLVVLPWMRRRSTGA